MTDTGGYSKEWLAGGRVLTYRFTRADREAGDQWFHEVRAIFLEWNAERPLHLLLDLQNHMGIISAQALMRARQLSHVRPDLPGRTALVVGRGMGVNMISSLLRSGIAGGARQRMMFSSEEAALEWLLTRDSTSTAEIHQSPPPGGF